MFYRKQLKEDLVSFEVVMKETNLLIKADKNLYAEAIQAVSKYRAQIEEYGVAHPEFFETLEPYNVERDAPAIVKDMANFSSLCGVGPMASVAGAIAEYVGTELLKYSSEIIIENGGDIYLKSKKPRVIGIFAGESFFSEKIGLKVQAEDTPIGICTSSGIVGHSLSFGKADAAVAVAKSAILADACASAIGNLVKGDDFSDALSFAKEIQGLDGVVVIKDDRLGVWGNVIIEQIR